MAEYNITKVIIGQTNDGKRVSYFEFKWIAIRQSILDNTSDISWELRITTEGGASYDAVAEEPYKVTVNGAVYEGKSSLKVGTNSSRLLASGEEVIQHNPDGTGSFDFSFSVELDGRVMMESNPIRRGSGVGTLDPLPRYVQLSSAPNFTDEDNPTITFIDPLFGSAHSVQACISFTGAKDDIPYREITTTVASRSYTFNLTTAERATLRSKLSSTTTSTTVVFYIKTIVNEGDTPQYSTLTRTLTYVNYEPILNPSVVATDGLTKELTGDSSGKAIIKNHSTVSFNTGATARKGATIEHQRIQNGSQVLVDYTSNTGTFTNVTSNTFYFSVTDSRGYTIKDAVVFSIDDGKFIEYFKPTCSIKSTDLDSNGNLTFTIVGKYFDGSFGAKDNTFEIDYGLQENGGDINWYRTGFLNPTVDGEGNYELTYTITGLNYDSQYDLQVYVVDAITNSSTSSKVLAATTIFDWGKDDFAHHTNVYLDAGKTLRTTFTDGTDAQILGVNTNNNLTIGWGGYDTEAGNTGIYGKNVNLYSKEHLYINGRQYGQNKILWSGAYYMNESQTITLNESITAQPTGIVLIFSAYDNSTKQARDVGWSTHFVPKLSYLLNASGGQCFLMGINAGFSQMAAKYLFFDNDTQISGHSGNTSSGANSGITFNNSNFVLRYVIGV